MTWVLPECLPEFRRPHCGCETVMDHRIRTLRPLAQQLVALLDVPEPGLDTWVTMVGQVLTEINAVREGRRDP